MKRLGSNKDGIIIQFNDGRTQHIAFEYKSGDTQWYLSNKAVRNICVAFVMLAALAGQGLINPALASTVEALWKLKGLLN